MHRVVKTCVGIFVGILKIIHDKKLFVLIRYVLNSSPVLVPNSRKETLKSVFFRFGPGLRNGCQVSVSRPVALLVAGTLKRWYRYALVINFSLLLT